MGQRIGDAEPSTSASVRYACTALGAAALTTESNPIHTAVLVTPATLFTPSSLAPRLRPSRRITKVGDRFR